MKLLSTKTNLLFVFLLFFNSLNSCDSKPESQYKYEKGFKNYLSDVHDINNKIINQIYYIVPLYSCSPCVDKNLSFLSSLNKMKNFKIILIGESSKISHQSMVNSITKKHNTLFDKENKAQFYELGLGKPIIIHFENEIPIHYQQIGDNQINEIHDYFNNLNRIK
jgi:hypothetical protein